jgi:hypothetical protein
MLARFIERETADAFDLNNRVSIEVATASFRSTSGYTLIAGLLDELAFWRTDGESSANPDTEIIAALRPAMSTIPGAMLLCASSPYARRGVLWDAFRRYHGRDGSVLVWKAATATMNPTVSPSIIAEAYEADPASAAAEYGAEFRTDVETYIAREVVEAAIVKGRHELAPALGYHIGFVDPSGGSSDSMTLAIARRAPNGHAVLVALRERRPPFSPEAVVDEFCDLLKGYGLHAVTGDHYAGEWPRERFLLHGVRYVVADKAKSDIYRDLLPLLNSGKVELLDHSRLVAQLCGLERRTARSGKDSIDHAPGGHDDVANAVAGALTLAAEDKSAWMKNCALVAAKARAMPPYRRPLIERRNASAMLGERRAAQLRRFRGF